MHIKNFMALQTAEFYMHNGLGWPHGHHSMPKCRILKRYQQENVCSDLLRIGFLGEVVLCIRMDITISRSPAREGPSYWELLLSANKSQKVHCKVSFWKITWKGLFISWQLCCIAPKETGICWPSEPALWLPSSLRKMKFCIYRG